MAQQFLELPDKDGYFGEYGGQIVPPELKAVMDEIATAYEEVSKTKAFQDELQELYADFVGEDLDVLMELSDRIMVLCGGEVSGILDARKTDKNEVGMLMTRVGGKEHEGEE